MRKTATFIYCDGPECEAAVEQPGERETPVGWYIVVPVLRPANGGTAQRTLQDGFTLCSLDCVATWAMAREEALDGKPDGH